MDIFKSHPELVVGYSTVADGNMGFPFGDMDVVEIARRNFCRALGIDIQKVVAVSLEHGRNVVIPVVTDGGKGMVANTTDTYIADGGVTNLPNLGLCFVIADCVPVVLYDPVHRCVALLHAGRKGVEKNIVQAGFKKLVDNYGSNNVDIVAYAAPGIAGDSYVFDTDEGVDKEFWQDDFRLGSDNKFHMDIKAKIKNQILELGVPESNIDVSQIDTFTDKNYFSHRRSMATGEPEGRFAAIVYIKQ